MSCIRAVRTKLLNRLAGIVSIFLVLVALADPFHATGHPPLEGYSWPEVKARGSGTLTAVYVPAEGFASYGPDGLLTGVTVELLRAFGEYLSEHHAVEVSLSFVRQDHWRTFYQDIVDASDGVIGMGNVTITDQRRSELSFSPPYMTNIASLITHSNAPELSVLTQLESTLGGRTALAFEGTLHEERLRSLTSRYYPGASVALANSNDEIIEQVGSDDRFFAYIDLYNYWRAVERGHKLRRHEVADQAAEQFGYIMPLNTTWEPVLRAFFEHNGGLVNSELYRSIMHEHLGERLADILLDAGAHTD